jgi:hypothetical protein
MEAASFDGSFWGWLQLDCRFMTFRPALTGKTQVRDVERWETRTHTMAWKVVSEFLFGGSLTCKAE